TSTVDDTGRASIQTEFVQIQAEIARIATQTNFNGVGIFTATGINGSLSVFVGDLSTSSSINVTIDVIETSGDTVTNLGGIDISGIDLSTAAGAQAALTTIKSALSGIATSRAEIGAGMNRLQSAVTVLQAQSINTQSAESVIRDANVAEEVANLTKFQILAQSGIAALAQANSNSTLVLSLLQK
ncbi:MAG: flagellin, partial [Acidobacteria bacterium]|nr:flagellin [Acidobacteriota bacterium]